MGTKWGQNREKVSRGHAFRHAGREERRARQDRAPKMVWGSDEWLDTVASAVRACARNGLKFTMNIAADGLPPTVTPYMAAFETMALLLDGRRTADGAPWGLHSSQYVQRSCASSTDTCPVCGGTIILIGHVAECARVAHFGTRDWGVRVFLRFLA